jgi:hypothetical protein
MTNLIFAPPKLGKPTPAPKGKLSRPGCGLLIISAAISIAATADLPALPEFPDSGKVTPIFTSGAEYACGAASKLAESAAAVANFLNICMLCLQVFKFYLHSPDDRSSGFVFNAFL